MIVKKEMYTQELQSHYRTGRLLVSIARRKWSMRILHFFVSLVRGRKIKSVRNTDHVVPSSTTQNHKIPVRMFRPKEVEGPIPAMLYLHGGGYMMGLPEQALTFYENIIQKRNVAIIAPNYRLSPQSPYPAGFNDCYDTLLWMRDNAESLNLDPNNFIVAGHSAGGGMAAAVTLKVRDTQDVKLAFQMPIYPMLDHRRQTESSKMLGSPVWDAKSNKFAWNLYLRGLQGRAVPPYASPALNEDYRGFPPTISFVGDLEPFYDENVAYCEALEKAGVPVQFRVFEGTFHGFEVVAPKTTIGQAANKFQVDAFAEFYDRYVK
ncbi:MAG: alpha/beta hydrolase [Bacteroidota bacterium]